jgi:hypothetical protein
MATHPDACHLFIGDGQCHKYSHIHQLAWDHLSELNFGTLWAPKFTLSRLSHIQAAVRTTSGPIFTSLKTWLWMDKGKWSAQPCDDSSWFSQDLCNQAHVYVGRPLTFCLDKMSNTILTHERGDLSMAEYRKENVCTLCTFHCLLIWWMSQWCKQVNKFNDYLVPTIHLPQVPGLYSYEAND